MSSGKIFKFKIGSEIDMSSIDNHQLMELYVDKILNGNLESDVVINAINREMQERNIVAKNVSISFNFIVNGKETVIHGTSF